MRKVDRLRQSGGFAKINESFHQIVWKCTFLSTSGKLCVHDLVPTVSTEETIHKDFQEKILKKCFLGTTCIVILQVQILHHTTRVLPVAKSLMKLAYVLIVVSPSTTYSNMDVVTIITRRGRLYLPPILSRSLPVSALACQIDIRSEEISVIQNQR